MLLNVLMSCVRLARWSETGDILARMMAFQIAAFGTKWWGRQNRCADVRHTSEPFRQTGSSMKPTIPEFADGHEPGSALLVISLTINYCNGCLRSPDIPYQPQSAGVLALAHMLYFV